MLDAARDIALLDFYKPNDIKQFQFTDIASKGLRKTFDLNLDYVDRKTRYDTEVSEANYYTLKNIMLAEAKLTFLQGSQVEVVEQIIPDGLQAQISWNDDAKAWVIKSGTFTILAE